MTEERQLLYALVAVGLHLVSGGLIAAAGVTGALPPIWAMMWAIVWIGVGAVGFRWWRRTARVLSVSVAMVIVVLGIVVIMAG